MRLMKLSQYRRQFYVPGSMPSLATLRAKIDQIPGGTVMHGHYYVDLDKLEGVTNLRADLLAREQEMAKSPLLAEIL